MSKRHVDESSSSGSQPPIKKINFEPQLIRLVPTLEEMHIKVLQSQNKKLGQEIEERCRTEQELKQQIEQLEKRQTQDDTMLNVVNRYWNQLNEDIRILLQRFDAETADESENKNENEATTSFLMEFSTWNKDELNDKLANRVQVSRRAVAKVIQAFDRMMQRNEKITLALKGELEGQDAPSVDEAIHQTNIQLQAENRNLQALHTTLHEKYHTNSLKVAELQDSLTAKETEIAELKHQIDNLQCELEKARNGNDTLETHLAEAVEKINAYHQLYGDPEKGVPVVESNVSQAKLEDLMKELKEWKELANNRLQKWDRLHETHQETLKEVEKLKTDIRQLPESVIMETTEYKCLQSQISVLKKELLQLKFQLDEARQELEYTKEDHIRTIKNMEHDELIAQIKLSHEVTQLEEFLAQLRKEYELLHVEFKQCLAEHERTGPISREVKDYIESLQNSTQQLKDEVHTYKHKYEEANAEIPKLRKEIEDLHSKLSQKQGSHQIDSNDSMKEEAEFKEGGGSQGKEEQTSIDVKKKDDQVSGQESTDGDNAQAGPGKERGTEQEKKEQTKITESEMVRDLRNQLKNALNEQQATTMLLEMYRGFSKDQSDESKLMAAESKLKSDLEELRQHIKKVQGNKREEKRKLAEDLKKMKQQEEQKSDLQRQVTKKPEDGKSSEHMTL